MKPQGHEHPLGKPQPRRNNKFPPKIVPFISVLVFFTILSISYPSIRYSQNNIISPSCVSSDSDSDSDSNNDPILIQPAYSDLTWPCPIEDVATQPCNPSGRSLTPPVVAAGGGGSDRGDSENGSSPPGNTDLVITTTVGPHEVQSAKIDDHDHESYQNSVKHDTLTRVEKANKVATRRKSSRRSRRRSGRWNRRDLTLTGQRIVTKKTKVNNKESLGWDGSEDVKVLALEVADNDEKCDLFSGEWVPNSEGPYYTNTTCDWAIQEHQNCMKFGRPDTGFLKWRWKPDGCELPLFDPTRFLENVRGKSLAFVGDSVARNHMQSLLCLLSRVAYPLDASNTSDQNFRRWEYRKYNFNISIFWSPYLVRTEKTDLNDVTRPFKLFLDEFDESWTTKIENFDYVIISAGHWFFRPTYFYLNGSLVGCQYCPLTNVSHLPSYFSYRWAFRTAFRAINMLDNFHGVMFLRTFAPSHFENGPWDKGGDCVRTKPLRRSEKELDDYNLEFYRIQLQELKTAQINWRSKGMKIKLFDATLPMLLRPDGHPSKFGRWPNPNVTVPSDCVHWCLPGPIDSWNDFLLELMTREVGDRKSDI